MNKEQQQSLAEKRKHLQLKLQAKEYIRRGIAYHWLDYFTTIKNSNLDYQIEFLCTATAEEQPYFAEAIEALEHPDLKPELIKVTSDSLVDRILRQFPSTSHFKYVMNLPLLAENESDVSKMLKEAKEKLGSQPGPVCFFSSDCCPLLTLQWNELVEHANQIFDDNHISLIFTDPEASWIIFRSIEEEWRCGNISIRNQ